MDAIKPTYVTGFQRTSGGTEVMYFESREQTDNAGISRSLIIGDSVELYNRFIEEVCELLEELIEIAVVDIRSPAKTLGPRERIAAKKAALISDEEEEGED